MESSKKQNRASACWQSSVMHSYNIAQTFFLESNDRAFVNRINNNDQVALYQFAFKYIRNLTGYIVKSVRHYGREKELMNLLLPHYFEGIKSWARLHETKPLKLDWEVKFPKHLGNIFYPIVEASKFNTPRKPWRLTKARAAYLNRMNNFLIKTEETIMEQARASLSLLDSRLNDAGSVTSEYEYFVEVAYYTKNSNGHPIFLVEHSFRYEHLECDWKFIGDSEDWREFGCPPELENRCCYLFHELLYHSHIRDKIFRVDHIWVDTKIWDQAVFRYKGDWNFEKFSLED